MDKKLFDESQLITSLPNEIVDIINAIDPIQPNQIYENIFISEKLSNFVDSIVLPCTEEINKKSALFEDVKYKIKGNMSKKGNKKDNGTSAV